MPQAVTRDSRGSVFGQPLRLESDGVDDARVCWHRQLSRAYCWLSSTLYYQSCRKADWVLDDVPATCPAIPGG